MTRNYKLIVVILFALVCLVAVVEYARAAEIIIPGRPLPEYWTVHDYFSDPVTAQSFATQVADKTSTNPYDYIGGDNWYIQQQQTGCCGGECGEMPKVPEASTWLMVLIGLIAILWREYECK